MPCCCPPSAGGLPGSSGVRSLPPAPGRALKTTLKPSQAPKEVSSKRPPAGQPGAALSSVLSSACFNVHCHPAGTAGGGPRVAGSSVGGELVTPQLFTSIFCLATVIQLVWSLTRRTAVQKNSVSIPRGRQGRIDPAYPAPQTVLSMFWGNTEPWVTPGVGAARCGPG